MIRLRVYCFGAFMAVLDGEELTGFRSDKARALLAYLLLAEGRPIPRTVLQELFWEGYEPKSARANLRVTLSNLAKLTKPLNLLHTTRQSVRLELSAACLVIGHAKRGLGYRFEAKNAYQEALSAWQANQKEKTSMEALAGLAAVAYERQRVDEALSIVEQIMAHRKENRTLSGTLEPMRILLTCIKVLEAAGQKDRADSLLEESYQLLMQRANDLENENLRESFLQRVSFNREIVGRWEDRARIFTRRAKAESSSKKRA